MNNREENKKKITRIRRVGGILIAIFAFCLICPPITALFDRSDIWVGIMPLSQFYIFLFTGLITATLFILYKFDAKYDNDELDVSANKETKEAKDGESK